MTTKTISIAPSFTGLVHQLLAIQARPDDCSDNHDFPKEQLPRRRAALAEAKKEVERTFLFCAQVADLVEKHKDTLPKTFLDELTPIIKQYKDDE